VLNLTQKRKMNPRFSKGTRPRTQLKSKRNTRLKQLRNPNNNKIKSQLPPILLPRFLENLIIWTLLQEPSDPAVE